MGGVGFGTHHEGEAQEGSGPVPVAGFIRVDKSLIEDGLVVGIQGISAMLAPIVRNRTIR